MGSGNKYFVYVGFGALALLVGGAVALRRKSHSHGLERFGEPIRHEIPPSSFTNAPLPTSAAGPFKRDEEPFEITERQLRMITALVKASKDADSTNYEGHSIREAVPVGANGETASLCLADDPLAILACQQPDVSIAERRQDPVGAEVDSGGSQEHSRDSTISNLGGKPDVTHKALARAIQVETHACSTPQIADYDSEQAHHTPGWILRSSYSTSGNGHLAASIGLGVLSTWQILEFITTRYDVPSPQRPFPERQSAGSMELDHEKTASPQQLPEYSSSLASQKSVADSTPESATGSDFPQSSAEVVQDGPASDISKFAAGQEIPAISEDQRTLGAVDANGNGSRTMLPKQEEPIDSPVSSSPAINSNVTNSTTGSVVWYRGLRRLDVMLFVLVALLLTLLVTGAITWRRQWRVVTMQIAKAAEASSLAAQEASRNQQRAWVGLAQTTPQPLNFQGGGFELQLLNSGRTPAQQVMVTTAVLFADHNSPTPESPDFSTSPHVSAGVLLPNANFKSNVWFKTSPEGIAAVTGGKMDVFAYVLITYQDAFARDHSTRACFHWYAGLPAVLSCDSHNEAD